MIPKDFRFGSNDQTCMKKKKALANSRLICVKRGWELCQGGVPFRLIGAYRLVSACASNIPSSDKGFLISSSISK